MSDTELLAMPVIDKDAPVPTPLDTPVDNPPYVVPFGWADAPPAVPKDDPNMDAEAVAYLEAFHAPPDPRDPTAAGASDITKETAEDYLDSFVKPPDPRDPTESVIAPGDLIPPAPGPEAEVAPPATDPPVNVDVPYLAQDAGTLTCTMGNWENEPTAYTFQFVVDGLEMGEATDLDTVILTQEDVGKAFSCVVTAINAMGETEAPASNEVTVEAFP